MAEGEFKGWKEGTGYGFIKGESGQKDIFVMKKESADPVSITPGSLIEFEIETSERGQVATNVKLLKQAEIVTLPKVTTVIDSNEKLGFIKFWNDKKDLGYITRDDGGEDLIVYLREFERSGVEFPQAGDNVGFFLATTEGRVSVRTVTRKSWRTTGNQFSDTVQFRNSMWKADLMQISEPENWENSNERGGISSPILDSYIRHTYLRLLETGGLRYGNNERMMCFNTGLVTPNQESIYAILAKTTNPVLRPWLLQSFVKSSDRVFFEHFGGSAPPLAEYFVDQSDLLYDRKLGLILDIDHILENIKRFPENMRDNPFLARQLITSAQTNTEKRVYRNYKTAIPQFFRDKGRSGQMQLLLPLCLNNPSTADLALTVAKNARRDAYLGSTVLTLDMAYGNARLLARPDTEWLKP